MGNVVLDLADYYFSYVADIPHKFHDIQSSRLEWGLERELLFVSVKGSFETRLESSFEWKRRKNGTISGYKNSLHSESMERLSIRTVKSVAVRTPFSGALAISEEFSSFRIPDGNLAILSDGRAAWHFVCYLSLQSLFFVRRYLKRLFQIVHWYCLFLYSSTFCRWCVLFLGG